MAARRRCEVDNGAVVLCLVAALVLAAVAQVIPADERLALRDLCSIVDNATAISQGHPWPDCADTDLADLLCAANFHISCQIAGPNRTVTYLSYAEYSI